MAKNLKHAPCVSMKHRTAIKYTVCYQTVFLVFKKCKCLFLVLLFAFHLHFFFKLFGNENI